MNKSKKNKINPIPPKLKTFSFTADHRSGTFLMQIIRLLMRFNKKFSILLLATIFAGYYLMQIFIFSVSYSYTLTFAQTPAVALNSAVVSATIEMPNLSPVFTPSLSPSFTVTAPISPIPVVTLTPVPAAIITPKPVPTIIATPTPIITSIPAVTLSPVPILTPIPENNLVNYKFGIAAGNTLPGLSDGELNKIFDDMASLRVGWLRFDIDWENIQFSDSAKFDWQNIDRIVEAANMRRIKLLPVLAYTPKWARSQECSDSPNCPPADLNDYAIFVKEAVKRYEPKGIYAWEIWNEPNLIWYWRPSPSAQSYFEMLKLAHMTIRQQDPSAYIVLGGLGPADVKKGDIHQLDFLKQLYQLGAQPYFEVLGFHPYSYPVLPSYFQQWSAWSQMEKTAVSLRSIMKENNDDAKPIWLTEFGAPTNGPGYSATLNGYNLLLHPDHVTEDLQAEMLRDAFGTIGKIPWSGPLFWYSYKDIGTDTGTNENFFGLLRYDGSKKPAYEMLSNILSSQ